MTKNLTQGVDKLKEYLKILPTVPGVYQMVDVKGKIIYVGKARNLVKRVANYTQPQRLEYRIQNMVASVDRLEFITTETESEALLLEANLIKKHEPKYNILLKDGKSYPYILITKDHKYPRITKHRGKRKIAGKYYGPFASAGSVNKAISDIQKAFLIRPCSDSFFGNRKRPCMEYQIKRCSAPCVDKISTADYAELVKQTNEFLKGNSRDIQAQLAQLMEQASVDMDYEKAAVYRDRIKALNQIQAKQKIHISGLNDADIIALAIDKGQCCVQVFFYRGGQNFGNRAFYLKNIDSQSEGEILSAFISQFYNEDNIPPKDIFASSAPDDGDILQLLLTDIAAGKVEISTPKRGERRQIVEEALKNAEMALTNKLISSIKQSENLKNVKKLFGLDSLPERIEVYDNSHISGQNQVGAMIVAGSDGFNKKAYRRFNITSVHIKPGDDYAMMTEVLTRRFKRLKSECPEKTKGIWPDLVLIDGGAGHLSTAIKVFDELGLMNDIVFACISKGPDRNAGREQFHMPGRESFTLPHSDAVMYYLQTLRDEAHRFAIGSHRIKRSKTVSKSVLDSIPGIGPKRKKILLNHFGSADGVKKASVQELREAEGIDSKTAEIIYNALRS